jgi:hypothetical protein
VTIQIRISGKDLGALALPDFCPRCFWIRRHAPQGLPFQVFPGIFSSIDGNFSITPGIRVGWRLRIESPGHRGRNLLQSEA